MVNIETKPTAEPKEAVVKQLGERGLQEMLPPPELPEIDKERAATFHTIDPEQSYFVGCGDDRKSTDASTKKLAQSLEIDPDRTVRYFGGLYGVTRVLAVAIAAQYGDETLTGYAPNLPKFAVDVKDRIESNSRLLLGAHSAFSNEESAEELNPDAETGIGCAYCAGICAVTSLSQEESLRELAEQEEDKLFGHHDKLASVIAANSIISETLLRKDEPITREDFIAAKLPIAILEGAHAKSNEVVVAINFKPDEITSVAEAVNSEVPFYNNDVTIVAEALLRAYPELELDPELLLVIMDQDIRATRHALATHEPDKTAADMTLQRFGLPDEAIRYLQGVQEELQSKKQSSKNA